MYSDRFTLYDMTYKHKADAPCAHYFPENEFMTFGHYDSTSNFGAGKSCLRFFPCGSLDLEN